MKTIKEHQEQLVQRIAELEKQKATMGEWSANDFEEEVIHPLRVELLPNEDKFFSEYLWSDVNAYEVVRQCTPDKYVVRELDAELTEEADKALKDSFEVGGFCGHFNNDCQEWTFKSNPKNPEIEIRRHKNGKWYRANTRTCPFILKDHPYKFYDYNF